MSYKESSILNIIEHSLRSFLHRLSATSFTFPVMDTSDTKSSLKKELHNKMKKMSKIKKKQKYVQNLSFKK
jgi:hypothetical protein